MLQLLKETVSSRHSERLEQIVIALIAIEIGVFRVAPNDLPYSYRLLALGIVTILVDLMA
jgi:uncharacterized Rmd1/YagE family protein